MNRYLSTPLLCIALVAAPAFAGEGAYEINQDCAAAGCFPGDAPGFPVTITQSGRYVLTSDLVASGPDYSVTTIESITDGLTIELDFNGHMLEGGRTCTGTPVTACTPGPGYRGVNLGGNPTSARIHDGYIHGFGGNGMVLFFVTSGSSIERMRVSENGYGILVTPPLSDTPDVRVRDTQATRNDGSGISQSNGAVRLYVENCLLAGNAGVGISAAGGSVFVGNRVTLNLTQGIYCNGTCAFGQNTLSGNNGGGSAAQWYAATLRDMGGNVCMDDGTCP